MDEPEAADEADDAPPLAELTAEYVERQVTEGLRRELEHEENVVRSLPFFATSIGALLAFLGLVRDSLPSVQITPLALTVYTFLALAVLALLALLWFLYDSLRLRSLPLPMTEPDLVRYAEELTAYYATAATTDDRPAGAGSEEVVDRDRAVVAELRAIMIEQLAAATSAIRAQNLRRLAARSRAFSTLLVALFFALALFGAILIGRTVDGGQDARHARSHPAPVEPPAAQRQGRASAEADSTTNALGREGTVDVSRGGADRAAGNAQGTVAGGVIPLPRAPRLFGIDRPLR